MTKFEKRISPVYEIVYCPVGSCWKYGRYFHAKVMHNCVIQIFEVPDVPEIRVLTSMTSNEWEPSDNDAFIAAYCRVINWIAEISGIQHLPLEITYDNTSNPE
jgi:hypothetical protein